MYNKENKSSSLLSQKENRLLSQKGSSLLSQKENRLLSQKKAWVRIVEAFIAIMIVASVLIFVVTGQVKRVDVSKEIYKIETGILQEVSLSESLRTDILNNNSQAINNLARARIPSSMNFETRICDVDDACGMTSISLQEASKSVYVEEILISATLQKYSPKKLKIFVWMI